MNWGEGEARRTLSLLRRTRRPAASLPRRSRLILQSAISGRDLQVVDEKGQSDATAYVAEDPRVFQILVQSANLDWSFSVEEAVFGHEVVHLDEPSLRIGREDRPIALVTFR